MAVKNIDLLHLKKYRRQEKEQYKDMEKQYLASVSHNEIAAKKAKQCLALAQYAFDFSLEKPYMDYMKLYEIYQTGKVSKISFYLLLREILNSIGGQSYEILGFDLQKEIPNYPALGKVDYLMLVEKDFASLFVREFTFFEVRELIARYFANQREGLISSSTHALEFDNFLLGTVDARAIPVISGNPIFAVSNQDDNFSNCLEESLSYIKLFGFDYVDSPVDGIREKVYQKQFREDN